MTDSIATVNGIMLVIADMDPQVASAEEGLMFHTLLTWAPFCPARELDSLRKKLGGFFFSGLLFLCWFSKNLMLRVLGVHNSPAFDQLMLLHSIF